MPNPAQPLNNRVPIVNADGTPTAYFIRMMQEFSRKTPDTNDLDGKADKSVVLTAGHGLSGGGDLSANRTFDLDANIGDLNDVDLSTPPTDQQVLVFDAGTSRWVPADQSGGSGSISYWVVHDTGTGLSQNVTLPYSVDSEEDIDVFVNGVHYETDEYSVSGTTLTLTTNASGDSIEVRGELISGGGGGGGNWWFDPPAASSFSLMSSDSTNLGLSDDADEGLLIAAGALASDHTRVAYRTLSTPASAWDMVAKIPAMITTQDFSGVGLIAYNSTSARNLRIGLQSNATILATRWGTLNSGESVTVNNNAATKYNWYRIEFDGTNFNLYISHDGKQWALVRTETAASYVTATGGNVDRVGIFIRLARTTGLPIFANCPYFSLTGPGV